MYVTIPDSSPNFKDVFENSNLLALLRLKLVLLGGGVKAMCLNIIVFLIIFLSC